MLISSCLLAPEAVPGGVMANRHLLGKYSRLVNLNSSSCLHSILRTSYSVCSRNWRHHHKRSSSKRSINIHTPSSTQLRPCKRAPPKIGPTIRDSYPQLLSSNQSNGSRSEWQLSPDSTRRHRQPGLWADSKRLEECELLEMFVPVSVQSTW